MAYRSQTDGVKLFAARPDAKESMRLELLGGGTQLELRRLDDFARETTSHISQDLWQDPQSEAM